MGCAVLSHLTSLLIIIENGLKDEQQKIRRVSLLLLSVLLLKQVILMELMLLKMLLDLFLMELNNIKEKY